MNVEYRCDGVYIQCSNCTVALVYQKKRKEKVRDTTYSIICCDREYSAINFRRNTFSLENIFHCN